MYRRILVPLDHSQHATSALPIAIAVAQASHAELVLLSVMSEETPFDALIHVDAESAYGQNEMYLSRVALQLREQGVAARHVVMRGNPAKEIVLFSEANEIDLIAMATHARNTLDRWSFGSVADAVMRSASVPVLLCRIPVNDQQPAAVVPTRILVPLDGSLLSEAVMETAIEFASTFQATLVFLRVLEPDEVSWAIPPLRDDPYDPAFLAAANALATQPAYDYLTTVAERYGISKASFTSVVKMGPPATTIVDVATHETIDVIAMATHGRSGFKRFALGSVTSEVLKESLRPVLILSANAARHQVERDEIAESVTDAVDTRGLELW